MFNTRIYINPTLPERHNHMSLTQIQEKVKTQLSSTKHRAQEKENSPKKPIEAIDHLHTTKAPRSQQLMEEREEFHPKSTQEVVVMRWGEMEKKVVENGKRDGDEEENMEDLW